MAERYDENLILGYLEGDLSPADHERMEAQLAQDAALRRLVEGLAADRDLLRTLPDEAPPTDLVDDVLARTERSMLLGDASVGPGPGGSFSYDRPRERRLRIGRVLAFSGLAATLLLSGGVLLYTLLDVRLLEQAERYQPLQLMPRQPQEQMANATAAPETAAPAEASPPEPTPQALARQDDQPEKAAAPEPTPVEDAPQAMEPASLAEAEADRDAPSAGAAAMLSMDVAARRGNNAADAPAPAAAEAAEVDADATAAAESNLEAVSPLRIRLRTRDIADAREDILQWATLHGVEIVSSRSAPADSESGAEVVTGMDATAEAFATIEAEPESEPEASSEPGETRLVMRVGQDQVGPLVSHLRQRQGQEVSLVQSSPAVMRDVEEGSVAASPAPSREVADNPIARDARAVEDRLARLMGQIPPSPLSAEPGPAAAPPLNWDLLVPVPLPRASSVPEAGMDEQVLTIPIFIEPMP